MSYLTQNEISQNAAMTNRVAQAATAEDLGAFDSGADSWASTYRREWASAPGWDAAWESAKVSHPDDGDPSTPPYDPGMDEAVITDGQILSQVQAMLADQATP